MDGEMIQFDSFTNYESLDHFRQLWLVQPPTWIHVFSTWVFQCFGSCVSNGLVQPPTRWTSTNPHGKTPCGFGKNRLRRWPAMQSQRKFQVQAWSNWPVLLIKMRFKQDFCLSFYVLFWILITYIIPISNNYRLGNLTIQSQRGNGAGQWVVSMDEHGCKKTFGDATKSQAEDY